MPSAYKAKRLGAPPQAGEPGEEVPERAALGAPASACPSLKVPHETQADALRSARDKMMLGAPALAAYRCPECGRWHLTSKPRPAEPKRRRKAG